MSHILEIVGIVVCELLFLLLVILASQWCVRDAEKRGKQGLWVWLACFLFFPWGLIAWLIFRPPVKQPPATPAFRLEDHQLQ